MIGCCTFPTWNGYPGMFASLATGNAVVVKPHPGAILPLAISVEIARDVLREAGFDPNVVTMVAHDAGDDTPQKLALRPEVKLSISRAVRRTANGWSATLIKPRCIRRKPASIRSLSTRRTTLRGLSGMSRSRWRCTPARCARRRRTFMFLKAGSRPRRASEFRPGGGGAGGRAREIARRSGARRRDSGRDSKRGHRQTDRFRAGLGEILLDSRELTHPVFPKARIRTPLLLKVTAADETNS